MSTELIMFIIAAVTIVLVVILWQGMNVARTQISAEQLEKYRKLAEQATEAEQKAAREQQKISEALEDMRARLTAIEKFLREVQ